MTGLEPARLWRDILSVVCLPFHHIGIKTELKTRWVICFTYTLTRRRILRFRNLPHFPRLPSRAIGPDPFQLCKWYTQRESNPYLHLERVPTLPFSRWAHIMWVLFLTRRPTGAPRRFDGCCFSTARCVPYSRNFMRI